MTAKELRFERDTLLITANQTGSGWIVRWIGASDFRDPGSFIQPIVEQIIQQVRGKSVTLDFTGLSFMNSSTVSPIIRMLKSLNANEIATRVEFSDAEWQQTHLRCIRTISRALEHVTVIGRPA